jgi:hypothetical protein
MSLRVTEQFIQDGLCDEHRLQEVVRWFKPGWTYQSGDYEICDIINQEVNFSVGRLDVLATFDNRKKVAILETKAGDASDGDLAQLKNYLDARNELFKQIRIGENTEILGILVAEGFQIQKSNVEGRDDLGLVLFKKDGRKLRFEKTSPETLASEVNSKDDSRIEKRSALVVLQERINYVDPSLRCEFEKASWLFLDDEKQRQWVVRNPKGDHIAVHYKGVYVVHLWPRRKYFYLGVGGSSHKISIPGDIEITNAQKEIEDAILTIDKQMRDVLREASWN